MPRAHRPCLIHGCPHIAVFGGRCLEHAREYERQTAQAYEAQRPTSRERGYDAKWTRVRREYLKHNPVCAYCDAEATDVHHLQSIRQGGTNDTSNLIALCHRHHSMITGKTQAWGRSR